MPIFRTFKQKNEKNEMNFYSDNLFILFIRSFIVPIPSILPQT